MKPLAVDLCAGLGGWTDGLLAEGWDVIGFDIERHVYGDQKYPAQLVLQDILTLSGHQFRGKVSLITASPPCQKYSYMSMPWSKAKALAKWYRDPDHPERIEELNALFNACVRIGKEAECPIIIENVKGAQPWVGRSRWAFGSFHLFGDVPALMPHTFKASKMPGHSMSKGAPIWGPHTTGGYKTEGMNWSDRTKTGQDFTRIAGKQAREDGVKQGGSGAAWWRDAVNERRKEGTAIKNGRDWFGSGADCSLQRRHAFKSTGRKAASAMIARIPLPLARHIAAVFRP